MTQVLALSSVQDPIITLSVGRASKDALKKAIPDYTWAEAHGEHVTAWGPISVAKTARWLNEKTPVKTILSDVI